MLKPAAGPISGGVRTPAGALLASPGSLRGRRRGMAAVTAAGTDGGGCAGYRAASSAGVVAIVFSLSIVASQSPRARVPAAKGLPPELG
jgi:hypothetical protein